MKANDCQSRMQQRKLSDCLCEVPMGASPKSCTVITALETRDQGVEQSVGNMIVQEQSKFLS